MLISGLHVTETERALSIEANGFNLDPNRLGSGRLWGAGIYLAATLGGLEPYAAVIDEPALLHCAVTVSSPLVVRADDLGVTGMRATFETLFSLLSPGVREAVAKSGEDAMSEAMTSAGYDALILDRSHLGPIDETEYVIFDPSSIAVTARESTEALTRALDALFA